MFSLLSLIVCNWFKAHIFLYLCRLYSCPHKTNLLSQVFFPVKREVFVLYVSCLALCFLVLAQVSLVNTVYVLCPTYFLWYCVPLQAPLMTGACAAMRWTCTTPCLAWRDPPACLCLSWAWCSTWRRRRPCWTPPSNQSNRWPHQSSPHPWLSQSV